MREITLTSPLTQNEVLELENEITLKSINYKKQMKWLSVWSTIACFSLLYLLRLISISNLSNSDSFPPATDLEYFAIAGMNISIVAGVLCCFVIFCCSVISPNAPSKQVFCDSENEDRMIGIVSKYQITEIALFMKEIYSQKRKVTLIEYDFLNKYFEKLADDQKQQLRSSQIDLLCNMKDNISCAN